MALDRNTPGSILVHVSSLMAKECRKLSPSTDLQCIAITPGAPLSPSPRNEKNENT
jgi:hypothetical protein